MSPNALAKPAATGVDSGAGKSTRYLTFTLNGEAYALDIFNVTEILEHRPLTVVPMMPEVVRGVINLRGRAVPVVDLAVRFANGTTTIHRRTSIVIVHIGARTGTGDAGQPGAEAPQVGQNVGILVDAVNKVVDFGVNDIEPAPALGASIHADFISGMAKRDNDFIIVLDIGRVLSLDDLAHLGHADLSAAVAEETGEPRQQ